MSDRVRLIEGDDNHPYQQCFGDKQIGFVQYGVEFGHDRVSLEGQDTSNFPKVTKPSVPQSPSGLVVGNQNSGANIPPSDDLVTITFADGSSGYMSRNLVSKFQPGAASRQPPVPPTVPAAPRSVHESDPNVVVDPATQTDTPIPGETPIPVRDLIPEAGPIDVDGPFVETAKAVQRRLEVLQPDGSYKSEYPTSAARLKEIVEMAGLEA